ncbi:MOSC domain-containing protein [Luminiphilus sp.]|nr:MOSC domain-containing protein [Luminiphilus sp.]
MTQKPNPLNAYLGHLGTATIEWIGVRPRRREPLMAVTEAEAVADLGLRGDHRMTKTPGSGRQVTFISREFVTQIEQHLGKSDLDPAVLRRNIVVSGINLNALRRQQFWFGGALFEATQLCHPCARMESELGPGGVVAMMGYGGLCAKVLQTGQIAIGDSLRLATS